MEKETPLPNGEMLQVYIDKAECYPKALSSAETKCWCDLTDQHKNLFKAWLQDHWTHTPESDLKPNSMAQEVFEAIKGEVVWDTQYGFRKMLRTAVLQKGRETTEGRARQISQPGVNNEDAKRHQAISGPVVSIIEKFHLSCFNHRNFNWCTFTGKELRVAR